MKWKVIHLPSVYLLTHSLTHLPQSHNAFVSHLKLVPGFRACLNNSQFTFSIWDNAHVFCVLSKKKSFSSVCLNMKIYRILNKNTKNP